MCQVFNNLESVLLAEGVLNLRKCTKCQQDKRSADFWKKSNRSDGLSAKCKDCARKPSNPKVRVPDFEIDGVLSRKCKAYNTTKKIEDFPKNENCLNGRERKCSRCVYEQNKRNGSLAPTDASREYERNRRKSHGRAYKDKENAWRREYTKKNPNFELALTLRARVRGAFKAINWTKKGSSVELLGTSVENARKYIESLWLPGMSWENHGFGDDKWHIDHVVPVTAHDLTKEDEQLRCFHYTNLQPLWQKDNLQKSNKILTK
jgi:hypothetical protein